MAVFLRELLSKELAMSKIIAVLVAASSVIALPVAANAAKAKAKPQPQYHYYNYTPFFDVRPTHPSDYNWPHHYRQRHTPSTRYF